MMKLRNSSREVSRVRQVSKLQSHAATNADANPDTPGYRGWLQIGLQKARGRAGELKRGKHNLYILDEPTTRLQVADIGRLLVSLNRLVDNGHSVVVIGYNLDVIQDRRPRHRPGPRRGHNGGHLLAAGTPGEVAACPASHTGQFLAGLLTSRLRSSRTN